MKQIKQDVQAVSEMADQLADILRRLDMDSMSKADLKAMKEASARLGVWADALGVLVYGS